MPPVSLRVERAHRAARTDRQQHVEAEHGRRQHQRQRHHAPPPGISSAAARRRANRPAGTPEHQQDDRSRNREPHAEPDGLPVHVTSPADEKAVLLQDAPARRGSRKARKSRAACGILQDDAALFHVRICVQRAPPSIAPGRAPARRERQRQRHDSGIRRAALHELQGLRDVLAKHQFRFHTLVQPQRPQGGLGGASVGRVLRVGDGDVFHRRVAQRGRRIERRGAGHPHHDAAHGVDEDRVPARSRRRPACADTRRRPKETGRRARDCRSARRSCRKSRRRYPVRPPDGRRETGGQFPAGRNSSRRRRRRSAFASAGAGRKRR